jgi:predicted DNA-binding transcriptional regulator AlpA
MYLPYLLTTDQASDLLGLQAATLKKWRILGIGPEYVRLGRRSIRYRQSDVRAFISQNHVEVGQ